jgi:methionine-rich copper-binding protein CopC
MRLSIKGMVSTISISVFALALAVPTAVSHTSFVSSNPAAGSVVMQWPDQISIEFDEDLISIGEEKANFIVVNNSVGDQVSNNDENIDSNIVTVSLSPNQVEGPVLVFYRVVSADGHPVEGEFTFTYGQDQPAKVIEEVVVKDKFPISIYIASAAFIASGIFFAIYSYRRRNRS